MDVNIYEALSTVKREEEWERKCREAEAERFRKEDIGYLFDSINKSHGKAVKLYDADTGKVVNTKPKPEQEQDDEDWTFWHGFAFGVLATAMVVYIAIKIAMIA